MATAARVTGKDRRLRPRHLGHVPEEAEQRRQGDPERGDRLGEGDPEVVAVDQRHGGQPEVGAQQHPQPAERKAHDRA